MTTATTTLSQFLLAQIEADEVTATAALAAGLQPHMLVSTLGGPPERVEVDAWDPARVLRQCEALREVVALHGVEQGHCCPIDGDDEHFMAERPCPTLRALARIYADRPGAEAWL